VYSFRGLQTIIVTVIMSGCPENQNRNVQKFDIRLDSFPTETACNPQLKLKVTKNFTCIQSAGKARFETLH